MRSAFVDTSVLLHAVGGEHPRRAEARDLLALADRRLTLHVAAETSQEFLFHRLRVGARRDAVQLSRWLLDVVVLHPFDATIARRYLDIVAQTEAGGRDAVIAATALEAGFDTLITHDARFVAPEELRLITAAEYLEHG